MNVVANAVGAQARAAQVQPSPPVAWSAKLPPPRALCLPLLFIVALFSFTLYAPVRQNPRLLWSLVGGGTVLIVWDALLLMTVSVRQRRVFTLEIVLRKQHYVQACAHTSIFLYWGWYWRPVYESAYLIVAQLLFAYAFDMLLSWSRRDTYTLGFGPFPIILSTNLFLWFKQDWFYLQFLMIAVGFAAKEFIRWNKDGRQTHIFNPSSFTLTIFLSGLILTGASDITWGKDIAITQFYPPHMYLFLFLVALPGQFLFGVTTMTMSAVLTTYLFGLAYYALSGHILFLRFLHSDCGLSRNAPALHGSVHGAADRARAPDLWRAVRAQHNCAVRAARRRPSHLLRQASSGAAAQPADPTDRPGGPIRARCAGSIPLLWAARWLRAGAIWRTYLSGRLFSPS